MKKTILTLFVCLSCIMIANARQETPSVIDTLAKRVINGLEVIPIRTTYEGGTIFWKLRVSDFDKHFQKFESNYPGAIDFSLESRETAGAIGDWKDYVWRTAIPEAIKALEGINIMLFVDKEGHVFTADFSMKDEVFQKLNTLPENTLKNLYQNLIKENCETIKDIEFHSLDTDSESGRILSWAVCGSKGIGKEYITISLYWYVYYVYGTCKPLPYEELKKIDEKMQEREKSKKSN